MPPAHRNQTPSFSPVYLFFQAVLLGAPSVFIWYALFPMWTFGFFLTEDAPFFLGMFLAGAFILRARGSWSLGAALVTLVNIVVFWISAFSWHRLLHQRHFHGGGFREAAIVNDIASLWHILFLIAICVHLYAFVRHLRLRRAPFALFHAALILSQVACLYYCRTFMQSF